MPDYSIDPTHLPWSECAWCGATDDIVEMHIRNAARGGVAVMPGCRGCNSSNNNSSLKPWLKGLFLSCALWSRSGDERGSRTAPASFALKEKSDRWCKIVSHNRNKRNDVASLVRQVLRGE